MKISRTLRYANVKVLRLCWKAHRQLTAELKFILEPFDKCRFVANVQAENENLTGWQCFERFGKVVEVVAFVGTAVTVIIIYFQLRLSHQSMVIDQRAWVGAFHVIVENPGNDIMRTDFRVEFQNTGKTPAVHVYAWMDGETYIPDDWSKMRPDGANVYNGMLTPSAVGSIGTPNPLSYARVKAIGAGMPYYVFGKIWYVDIFHQSHWSEFCYQVAFKPEFYAFPVSSHNTCDDGETGLEK